MPDGSFNAFCRSDAPTLASLVEQINADLDLTTKQRQEMASAVRSMARWLGLMPEAIPANLGFLRRKLERINATSAGVSQGRFDNVRSLVMAAFRQAGLDAFKASYMCPLTPAWQALHDQLCSSYQSWGLSRFMRFCSSQGIAPDDVDQWAFDRFGTALAEESLVKHPRADHQTACRLWNKMRVAIPGWPDIEITVPHRDCSYALSWDDCRPAMVAEVQAYLDHLAGADLLASRQLVRPMAERSRKAIEGNLKRYLGALRGAGIEVAELQSLRDLIALDRVERGLRWLWERNGRQLNTMIGDIAWTLRCVAVKHLGVDDDTEARFKEIVDRTRIIRTGLSEKNRTLLEKFDDRRLALAFVGTPMALWKECNAESATGRHHKAALLAQDAVLVEILLFAPMRVSNLAALDQERHFSWIDGKEGTQLQITVPAEEVKNRERLTYLLPVETTLRIRTYLADWRPVLAEAANTALVPGEGGGHKGTCTVRKQVKAATMRHVGIAITPHQFRHIGAKLLLDAQPGAYEVVRRVLGHKSLSVTLEHYAGGESKAAVAFYGSKILEYAEPENALPKRRSKRKVKKTDPAPAPSVRLPVPAVRLPARKQLGTYKP